MYFDFATEGKAQIFSVYTITNATDKTVVVKMPGENEVPFIAFPEWLGAAWFSSNPG